MDEVRQTVLVGPRHMPPIIAQGQTSNGLTTYSVKDFPQLSVQAKSWLEAERELRQRFDALDHTVETPAVETPAVEAPAVEAPAVETAAADTPTATATAFPTALGTPNTAATAAGPIA